MFCLLPGLAEKMKNAIANGKINPAKLNEMTSIERRNFLSNIVGKEAAKEVNLLFEKKLLLKNQERAMYDWAREITGMSKLEKQEMLERIRKTYEDKQERMLSPKENEEFLGELASYTFSKKYKTDVSIEEAQQIAELTKDVNDKKKIAVEKWDGEWKSEEDRMKYGIDFGSSKVALDNYINGLKKEANKEEFKDILKAEGISGKAKAVIENAKISFNFIAENSRAIVAGFFDNSFFGRQGRQALTRPATAKDWLKNFTKSLQDMFQVLKYGNKTGEAIMDGIKAEIYSRDNYLNGNYEKGTRLDVGIKEEEFPTSLPAKIPYLGRLFKSSEVAYEGGAMRLRADIADVMYKIAEKQGINLADKEQVKSINSLVNIMTGRGALGSLEQAGKAINKIFFSAKFAKSQIDKLTIPVLGRTVESKQTSFVRKQAAYNLLFQLSSTMILMEMFSLLWPDSVEFDPRSADFGKIKLGNTRFDLTGGIASYLVLGARELSQSTKSTVSGNVTKLNEGFGSQDGMDLFWSFIENKTSPMASVIKDLIKQETFEGTEPTFVEEARNLITPILLSTVYEAATIDDTATAMLALIAEGAGFSAATYSFKDNWKNKDTKEMTQLKEKIGEKDFEEANKKYNALVNEKLKEFKKQDFESEEDRRNEYTKLKRDAKQDVFREYKFKPKR